MGKCKLHNLLIIFSIIVILFIIIPPVGIFALIYFLVFGCKN